MLVYCSLLVASQIYVRLCAAQLPFAEYSKLYDLYSSTDGLHWEWNPFAIPWNFTGYPSTENDPCYENWDGITCNTECNQDNCFIQEINLSSHNLSGSIPVSFWNQSRLSFLYLNDNSLTGSLNYQYSTEICGSTHLETLDLSYNLLSSSLPSCLTNYPTLKSFAINNNYFSGPLPDFAFENSTVLVYMDLQSNYFTQSFPNSALGTLQNLATIILSNNKFSGPFPTSIVQIKNLTYLSLEFNYFEGTIPSDFGLMSNLKYLFLQNNYLLSGPIPSSFANLSSLNVVILCNNEFTGSLGSIFNPSRQRKLRFLDMSANQFSGPLPASLFQLPELLSLTIGKNCFTGQLPDSVCQATKLETLKLNNLAGLYANTVNYTSASLYFETCRTNFPYQIKFDYFNVSTHMDNVFMLWNGIGPYIGGTVPACLFNASAFPLLTNLYLAGNGFTGYIPNVVQPTAALKNVSLAHNKLSGTIPVTMQSKIFTFLDLSFNRLKGTIQEFQANADSTILLNNNRLSGSTPTSLNVVKAINVLTGNVFQNPSEQDLPPNDPSHTTYVQGSQQLDPAMYLLSSVLCVFIIGFFILWRYLLFPKASAQGLADNTLSARLLVEAQQQGDDDNISTTSSITENARIMVRDIVRWMVVADPDPVVSAEEVASIAGFRQVPGMFELRFCVELFKRIRYSALCVGLPAALGGFIVIPTLKHFYGTHTYQYSWIITLAYMEGLGPVAVIFTTLVILMSLLVWTIVVKNGLKIDEIIINRDKYMEDQIRNVERTSPGQLAKYLLMGLLFLVSDFAFMMAINVYYVLYVKNSDSVQVTAAVQLTLSCFKVAFNSMIIPIFLRQMVGENHASNFITFRAILFFINNIFIPCFATGVTDPTCFLTAFIGNDLQSSKATYPYCRVFDAQSGLCLLEGFTDTLVSYVPAFTYNYQCSSELFTNYEPVFMYSYVLNLLLAAFGPPLLILFQKKNIPKFLVSILPGLMWPESADDGDGKLLIMDGILVTIMSNNIVLFTFGFGSPPLAVATFLATMIETYEWQILYGRYLTQYSMRSTFSAMHHPHNNGITSDHFGLWKGVQNCVWVTLFGSALFYAAINIDFVGGFAASNLWVFFLTLSIPLVLWIGVKCTETSMTFHDIYNDVPRNSESSIMSNLRDSVLSKDSASSRSKSGRIRSDGTGISMRMSAVMEHSADLDAEIVS